MNLAAIRQDGNLQYFSARDTVLVARTSMATFKIARISFGADGSIYVQFPYFKEKSGILSEIGAGPVEPGPITYNLRDRGVHVSTDFKFSHHRSGIALFSKSGQEVVGPRRHSYPLDGPIGHIFQLTVYWLSGFEMLGKINKKAIYLGFDFPRYPSAILLRAEWRRKRDIEANTYPPGSVTGPSTEVMSRKDRSRGRVYFLGQPRNFPLQDHVLMITSGAVPLPTGADNPGMVFLGGWDPHEQQDGEPEQRLGNCLAFMYPASSPAVEQSAAENPGAV